MRKVKQMKDAGKTVIIISHDLVLHSVCDKVLCFHSSNEYQFGHHNDLVAEKGKYKELWDAYSFTND